MDGYHVFFGHVAIVAALVSLIVGAVVRRPIIALAVLVALTFVATSFYMLILYKPGVTIGMSISAYTTAFVSPVILGAVILARSTRNLTVWKF
ncbi:hypothetical protein [uncultured Sphingomonas sp.]|uniref:hypothetical protein n=1 Tax=uncultured Sphingomonas sp. TaxID=158754 RepID=UPI003747D15D